jgi:metallo-beta-lactamase class B
MVTLMASIKAPTKAVVDYRLSFQRLKRLEADILLANHPEFAEFEVKYQAQLVGKAEAFVKSDALKTPVAYLEEDFNAELAKQKGCNK